METQQISPLAPDDTLRPFWSVMIPTYNPNASYLEQTLKSVLCQGQGSERMQIEVVDDCSTKVDVESLVRSIAGDRVSLSRTPTNLGLQGCWNACIERSRGIWVHILHQDDYVGAGFYKRLEGMAESHPDVGLVASRSFFVDDEGVITGLTPRLLTLENGGHEVREFFYESKLYFPGVAVRRQCYEENGGFRSDLIYALDIEMWARIIGRSGGLVTPDVLAFYRMHSANQTMRLWGTGAALTDMMRINALFSERYPEFDAETAKRRLLETARGNERWLAGLGNEQGVRACREFWKHHAPIDLKLKVAIIRAASFASRAVSWGVHRLSRH